MRKVAILYPSSVPWMARCLDGIRRYAHENGGWSLFTSPPTLRGAEESALTIHLMRGWDGDAIIASINDESELRAARKMRIPVVNLAGGSPKSYGVPRVLVNHFKSGRLAADHLLSRGLRNLAFFGWNGLWYSEQRRLGFTGRAAEAGLKCEAFLRDAGAESSLPWHKRIAEVATWLNSLTHPTGIFAVTDYRARLLIEACHQAELRIPEDIAVIGMDNDETICEHSFPTLSSISRNSEQVGWEAAALAHSLMLGKCPPAADVILEPDGVIARQSTDMLYCEDSLIQQTLNYIRANLKEPFNIEQLAEHLGVSKRTLETRFRRNLQSSPHSFITNLRVQHAQALMQLPKKLTIEELASECGFGTARALYKVFPRMTGESLVAVRKRLMVDEAHRPPS